MKLFSFKLIKSIPNLCFILISMNGISQSTNYRIIENDPDRKNLIIHLQPFDVNAYLPAMNIGYSIQANWMMNKLIQADFMYRKAYLDLNADGVYAADNLKKASWFQAGAKFNFRTHTKNKYVKVVLKQTQSYRTTTTTYLLIPCDVKRISSFHGGIVSIHNNHKIDNNFTESLQENGIKGKDSNGNIRAFRDTINFETISYSSQNFGIYAGLNFRSIKDIIINTDSYGTRSNHTLSDFYFDFIFTPIVHYSLHPNDNQQMFKNIDISIPENKKKLLGWRAGYTYGTNKGFGFSAKMEIGQQPGIPGSGFFMNLGMGFVIKSRLLKK